MPKTKQAPQGTEKKKSETVALMDATYNNKALFKIINKNQLAAHKSGEDVFPQFACALRKAELIVKHFDDLKKWIELQKKATSKTSKK